MNFSIKSVTKSVLPLLLIPFMAFPSFANDEEVFRPEEYKAKVISSIRKNVDALVAKKDHIIGLEFILAAPSDGRFESRFGHALLRFVDDNDQWIDDYVLSFVALIDNPSMMYFKGVFGGYDSLPEVKSFGEFWEQYARTGRDLSRKIIISSKDERDALIDSLAKWSEDSSQFGSYTFLSRNCAGVLDTYLKDAGFKTYLGSAVIPRNLEERFEESFYSPYRSFIIQNPIPVIEKARTLLGLSQEDFFLGQNWPENSVELIEENFSDKEIKTLYHEIFLMPLEVSNELVKKHNYRSGATFDEVMSYQQVPLELYELCKSIECAESVVSRLASEYGSSELKNVKTRILNAFASIPSKKSTSYSKSHPGKRIQARKHNKRLENFKRDNQLINHAKLLLDAIEGQLK